jgi:carbon storage regulator
MLLIDRGEYERIRIGDDIWITVVRVKGNQVRLGIDCPKRIPIIREELLREARPDPEPGEQP